MATSTGGRLQVRLLKGRAVRKETGALRRQLDRNLFIALTQGALSNPNSRTQRIDLAGSSANSGDEMRWDRTVELLISQPLVPLTFSLWEKESFGEEVFIGQAQIHLYVIANQETHTKWFPLCAKNAFFFFYFFF